MQTPVSIKTTLPCIPSFMPCQNFLLWPLQYCAALVACSCCRPSKVTYLLFNEQDHLRCMSPLVAAASRGDVAEVRQFLKAGVPVSELDIRDGTDVSTMHTAVCEGHIPVVRCLIEEGVADIDSINYMGAMCGTAVTSCFLRSCH
jgi:hypothetical protein